MCASGGLAKGDSGGRAKGGRTRGYLLVVRFGLQSRARRDREGTERHSAARRGSGLAQLTGSWTPVRARTSWDVAGWAGWAGGAVTDVSVSAGGGGRRRGGGGGTCRPAAARGGRSRVVSWRGEQFPRTRRGERRRAARGPAAGEARGMNLEFVKAEGVASRAAHVLVACAPRGGVCAVCAVAVES